MSTGKAVKRRVQRPEGFRLSRWDDLERFRQLCYELLQFSTKGLLRKDFLSRVSEKVKESSGCDVIELWVKEGADKHYRCTVAGSRKMPFGSILVPCALGEETDLPPGNANELGIETVCCDVIKGSVDGLHPHISERGSFWAGEASKPVEAGKSAGLTSTFRPLPLPGPYKDVAIIPIRLDEECIGLLQLKSKKENFFTIHDVIFYEDISAVLGVALSHQYAQIELRERVKEMTCLYGIARVVAQPEASFDEIIQGIVELLPAAWLYPEITCARIDLNGQSYTTEGFRESSYRQVSDIVVDNQLVGFVEVAYFEKRLTLDEGPFLTEERNLIDSVAREVAIYYESAKAQEEKISLQEQLRHADRLATIGQLAAGVAHELNEPLGNILGFAQLAKKSPNLAAQVEQDLKNIESASLSAREIIKKLMTFARQLPPKKATVDLNKIVTSSIQFFEARFVKADIKLVCRLASDLPKITVDPGQINQVLVNLVVNAMQAMPEGGTLTVETRATEEGVHLSVEDTGAGIAKELTTQIFLPFFTTKDVHEGTGLGLAVVHGIVASHGGEISVDTEEGIGTRFVIYLPRNKPEKLNKENE
jgi:two-component system NtrC family sensor kinase